MTDDGRGGRSFVSRSMVVGVVVVAAAGLLGAVLLRSHLASLQEDGAPRVECDAVDARRTQGIIFTNPNVVHEQPELYCACLSEAARSTSSTWLLFGLITGFSGALLTLLGSALGPGQNAPPGSLRAGRGILLAGFGALLMGFALYCNSRATIASAIAADTHDALLLPKRKMIATCVHAKSTWMSSRTASAAQVFGALPGAAPPSTPSPISPPRP